MGATSTKGQSLRVLFTSGNLIKDSDGVSRVIYKMIDQLGDHGVSVHCISQTKPSEKDLNVPVTKVPSFPIPFRKDYRIAWGVKKILTKTIEEFKPDIIHIHTPDSLGIAAAKYGKKHNIPVFATHHTQFIHYLEYYHARWLAPFLFRSIKKMYSLCQAVLCPSRDVVDELISKGIGNAVLLHHGVDTVLFDPHNKSETFRKEHNFSNKIILFFVGQLVWYKDLAVLAQVYTILKEEKKIVFTFAGQGPIKERLSEMMPKAIFFGQLKSKELAVAYASSDIFVFPSTTETFGLVVLEAMASGIPAIGANAPGINDIIENGKTGFLTIPKNAHDFAKKVKTLLHDTSLRQKMGQDAHTYALSQSWDSVTQKLITFYTSSINKE